MNEKNYYKEIIEEIKKINKKEKQDNKQTSKDYSVFRSAEIRSAEASLKKINFLERTIKNLRSIN